MFNVLVDIFLCLEKWVEECENALGQVALYRCTRRLVSEGVEDQKEEIRIFGEEKAYAGMITREK